MKESPITPPAAAATILQLDDAAFMSAWAKLSDYERSAIGEAGFSRYLKLTPEVGNSTKRKTKVQTSARTFDVEQARTEEEIASEFTRRVEDDRLYVALWGHWLKWDGTRYGRDETLHTYDDVRRLIREIGAVKFANAKTVAGVERLLRADRKHAAAVDQFDCNSWNLNTPTGTIELTSGTLREHRREERMTKSTAVGPAKKGTKPELWLKFLDRVTGGDGALMAYLQRLVGYVLTGTTTEHVICFLYGSGANGKSTFINTIARILGDYSVTASAETFIETHTQQHPADLALCRGARLVTAQEIDEGRRWAMARIKGMTGGDKITARFMRQDFFTFTPTFKLLIAGNHKPGMQVVDEAIRRRLHLIPFTQFILPEERDPGLTAALWNEASAILAWAIEGCLAWQQVGLDPPSTVRNATEEYLGGQDVFGLWLDDTCEIDKQAQEAVGRLYSSYRKWAEKSGERFLGTKRFSQALEERGLARVMMTGGTRAFAGLRLRPEAEPELPLEER
jgi:putative DNA primase/helicase